MAFSPGKPWYPNALRRTLLDMHIDDWHPSFMASFSPETYFEQLRAANIASPMIYVQSHVGLCYWPTASGRMHRAFLGREDAVKRLFDMCNQAGMPTVLYYSLIFNNWAYDAYPAWRMLDVHGRGSRENGGRYGVCCPNNGAYRAFVRTQIEEFSAYFTFDGIFFDMPFWPGVCYCPACQGRWAGEEGGALPTVVDWAEERWRRFQKRREDWMGEFAMFATECAKALRPEVTVEHQHGNIYGPWTYGTTQNVAAASDYVGTDLYGGALEQSFAVKAWYNLTQNQPFQYMTSRCEPSLAEHTTTKSPDLLRQCAMLTLMHRGACLFIDAIDPAGTTDGRVYERLGRVFRETEALEPYLKGGRMVYNVGLYFSLDDKWDSDLPPTSVDDPSCVGYRNKMPHLDALYGACNVLRAHHIPYGVVGGWKEGLLEGLDVLVVPDSVTLSGEALERVKAYARGGGAVYLSGRSAPEWVEEVFGLCYEGRTRETLTYFAPEGEGSPLYKWYTEGYPMAVRDRACLYGGQPKGRVLASLTLPYTVPAPPRMAFGDGSVPTVPAEFDRRFASIHSNPPGRPTRFPAILEGSYGRGRVLYAAAPIEKMDRQQHDALFAELIGMLMGEKAFAFSAKAPSKVEVLLFSGPGDRATLGVIDLEKRYEAEPVFGIALSMPAGKKPASVRALPENREIPCTFEEGRLHIRLEEMTLYTLLDIRFGP